MGRLRDGCAGSQQGQNNGDEGTIGGQPCVVTFIDENTLKFAVPTLGSGAKDIVLRNAGGGTYTLDSGITVP